MGIVVQRSLPILLLVVGIASIIYGARFHTQVVLEDREEEVDILIPLAGAGGMGFQLPGDPALGPPGANLGPDDSPSFIKEKRTRTITSEKIVVEPILCREVSIGGVRLLESGELQQTYSGRPPSLCPT